MRPPKFFKRLVQKRVAVFKGAAKGNLVPLYPCGDRRKRPIAWLNRREFRSMCADGVFVPVGERFVLSKSFQARILTGASSHSNDTFSAQHRNMETQNMFHPDGIERLTRRNTRGRALNVLKRMKAAQGQAFLSADEVEAAERFMRDYHNSGLGRLGNQSYDRVFVDGDNRKNTTEDIAIAQLDAKKKMNRALSALGPGLDKAVIAVCSDHGDLEALERKEGWAKNSGRTLVKLALARLSDFYGCKPGVMPSELSPRRRFHTVNHRAESVGPLGG